MKNNNKTDQKKKYKMIKTTANNRSAHRDWFTATDDTSRADLSTQLLNKFIFLCGKNLIYMLYSFLPDMALDPVVQPSPCSLFSPNIRWEKKVFKKKFCCNKKSTVPKVQTSEVDLEFFSSCVRKLQSKPGDLAPNSV